MDTFWETCQSRFDKKKSEPTGNLSCIEWLGAKDRQGYGRVFFLWPSKCRTEERAHRVALYLQARTLPSDFTTFDASGNKLEVSHLCHNNSCVRTDHLIIEAHHVNMERLHCRQQGFCCKSHKPYCFILCKLGANIFLTASVRMYVCIYLYIYLFILFLGYPTLH